jgi:ammonium transporter
VYCTLRSFVFVSVLLLTLTSAACGQTPAGDKPAETDPAKVPATQKDVADAKDAAGQKGDVAWMLTSTGLVLFMMPGLALFYGGMARRKNVLGTMMHTMIALGIVGVQWVILGYAIAFGETKGGYVGWSPDLLGLSADAATADKFKLFPNTQVPLYLHAMFQGMFAIITVALVSGAFAERVKFGAYCLFALLWTTLVYDPLAHWVWAAHWTAAGDVKAGDPAGWLGAMGALDFAGGTVVHIAAGVSGLAAVLLLRKRAGYGKQTFHPNSMVLTLLGAGMLWFGWFGFNGGSATASNAQAVSALTVTQVAAAAAGLAWVIVEWLHRGKPTALGFASGLVAGLVAITPASGFVAPGGALIIGIAAGVVCYGAVALKGILGYDDSLDAFGIHGVGGILGAILTGALCSVALWRYGTGGAADAFPGAMKDGVMAQVKVQAIAAAAAAAYAFVATSILVILLDKTIGFTCSPQAEAAGLDLSQHGETGFDMGPDVDAGAVVEPKAAVAPPNGVNGKRFTVVVDGPPPEKLMAAWSDLCQAKNDPPGEAFKAVYPYVTTITGNKFRFRGGDALQLKDKLKKLFEHAFEGTPVKTHVEPS